MSTTPGSTATEEELHSGDRMSRAEFHRIYDSMPEGFRAELVGGVVYAPSPLKRKHGTLHVTLGMLFGVYEGRTPGVEPGDNTTLILGEDSEPQPDLFLRILPERGGQSRTTGDDYVEGAPELVLEIAHSSHALDLHAKRDDYAKYGVREYVVVSLREQRFCWFDLANDEELAPDDNGVAALRTFPGFWIQVDALWDRDHERLLQTLEDGLACEEHAEFVTSLSHSS